MIGYLLLASLLSFILMISYHRYNNKKNKIKPFLYYVGIGYLLIGIPLLPSFLIFIGMYFLVFGIGILFVSDKLPSFKIQLLILFMPILLLLAFNYYEESPKNIFLIPENYKGRILIIHDCEQGQSKEFEGWFWRKYTIGKDGVTYSKFSWSGHSFDHLNSKYFYVDGDGNRKELKEIFSSEDNSNSGSSPKIFGLSSLPNDSEKSKSNINFIIDDKYSNPLEYHPDESKRWLQKSKLCD